MPQAEYPIDFVIAWVDETDHAWRVQKQQYEKETAGDSRIERYRNWDTLRYWFRGVEKYAPWVRKIHFVTCGQIPEWLQLAHPKLCVVNHREFIPQAFLPTFNANTIELNFHRIPDLAEHFVYFNDDMFLTQSVQAEDFFVGGLPCDMLAFQPIVLKPENPIMAYVFLNNTAILAKYFQKRRNVRSQPLHYYHLRYPPLYLLYNLLELAFPLFTGFYTVHGAAPLRKETYRQVWEREADCLSAVCQHRFRSKEDVNQYLLREWQKLSGQFHAKNIAKDLRYFELQNDNRKLLDTIRKQRMKMICINDANSAVDYVAVKAQLQQAFASVFPNKSQFER